MFLARYNLREEPFGVTPDPRFLYLTESHRAALSALQSGIARGRGFLALVAGPGMGKTTLANELLSEMGDSVRSLFLFQTQCDSRELFRYLLSGLGAERSDGDFVAMHEQLNEILARESLAGRRFVLLIDEAQNMSESVLETVRLLSDFETTSAKLMQIVLIGQPQLAKKLSFPDLTQLRQRLAIVAQIEPLSVADTLQYVQHRLRVAGHDGSVLFTVNAIERIALLSGGIPRVINNICSNALEMAAAGNRDKIDSALVEEAASHFDLEFPRRKITMPSGYTPRPLPPPAPEPAAPRVREEAPHSVTIPLDPEPPAPPKAQPQPQPQAEPQPPLQPQMQPQLQTTSRMTLDLDPAPMPPRERSAPVPPVARPEVSEGKRSEYLRAAPVRPARVSPLTVAPYQPARQEFPRQYAGPPPSYTPNLRVISTESSKAIIIVAIILLLSALTLLGWYQYEPLHKFVMGFVAITAPVSAQSPVDSATSQSEAQQATPSADTNSSASSSTAPAPSSIDDNHPMNAITVVVKAHQTLREICMEYVGRYDENLLREIRGLNPGIKDFDHIVIGQEIWLPVTSRPKPPANTMPAAGSKLSSAHGENP